MAGSLVALVVAGGIGLALKIGAAAQKGRQRLPL